MSKLGLKNAFPAGYSTGNRDDWGMSKRFYAACAAMQGLLSDVEVYKRIVQNTNTEQEADASLIQKAYMFADELLKQEDK